MWIGFAAVAIYVALTGGVANILTAAIPVDDPIGDLVLGHVTVVVPLIIAGIVFVRWAGWDGLVWQTPSAFETRPRRWWLLAFPVLLVVQQATLLIGAPWAAWDPVPVVVVAIVCLLIGFGEELYFRGILRATIRRRHGETLALVLTSLAFGLAHTLGAVVAGVDPFGIVFEIGDTALAGAVFYGAYRATGRLWVPILLHGLDDFTLHVSSADLTENPIAPDLGPVSITTQTLLWALTLVLLISCIRQDARDRRLGRDPRQLAS